MHGRCLCVLRRAAGGKPSRQRPRRAAARQQVGGHSRRPMGNARLAFSTPAPLTIVETTRGADKASPASRTRSNPTSARRARSPAKERWPGAPRWLKLRILARPTSHRGRVRTCSPEEIFAKLDRLPSPAPSRHQNIEWTGRIAASPARKTWVTALFLPPPHAPAGDVRAEKTANDDGHVDGCQKIGKVGVQELRCEASWANRSSSLRRRGAGHELAGAMPQEMTARWKAGYMARARGVSDRAASTSGTHPQGAQSTASGAV